MIYLYTEKKEDGDQILKNDLYFNLYTSNLPFTKSDEQAIFSIDGANVTEDGHIETRYGVGTIRNLSSGCKTYLNVSKNPEKVVSAQECGGNVLSLLFKLDGIHLYMDHPERFEIGEDVPIMIDDQEVVIGRKGYEEWWDKEYERRSADDL